MLFKNLSKNIGDLSLEKFNISENGFLPEKPPLHKFRTSGFEKLDEIANNLPELNKNKKIIEIVSEISCPYTKLKDQDEIERLYSVMCLICHSYLVNSGKHILPRNLAMPWHYSAQVLGINPILTHAAVDLYNWKLINPNGDIELDNLRCIHTMTGTMDEEWFFLSMTAIEKKGIIILENIFQCANNIIDKKSIINELKNISDTLIEITKIVNRMYEKCKPEVFYNVLRPYLAGWDNKDSFPNGIIFEGVSEEGFRHVGGSAAQSSLIPCIDAFLGINHKDSYFEKIKMHMPEKHRNLINFIKSNANIKEYISLSTDIEEKQLYKEVIHQLTNFRKAHFGLVKDYILAFTKDKNVRGTGGTKLEKFLKTAIKETQNSPLKYDRLLKFLIFIIILSLFILFINIYL